MEESEVINSSILELDTEVIKNRTEIASSLTDMNEVALFSLSFQNKKKETLTEEQEAENIMKQNIFRAEELQDAGNDVTESLFMGTQTGVMIRNEANTLNTNMYGKAAACVLILTIFSVLTLLTFKKRGKKKYDADNKPEIAV